MKRKGVKKMRFDLHNHTNYSDGVDTISSLAKKAEENHVDYFAITDHDGVIGHLNTPKELEGKIIKGIELSTYHNESIHLVGLVKNNTLTQGLIDFSYDFLEKRKLRAIKMVENLRNIYNLKVDIDALIKDANKKAVTRGNMARMLEDLNKDLTWEEIKFYLSNKSEAYIPVTKTSVEDGIKFLKQNNCFVILAHPMLYKKENLEEILGLDFDGIEAIYPNIKIEDYLYYKEIAHKYHYLISAGSDCHGDESHSNIGTCYLDEDEFKLIGERIGFKYARD